MPHRSERRGAARNHPLVQPLDEANLALLAAGLHPARVDEPPGNGVVPTWW